MTGWAYFMEGWLGLRVVMWNTTRPLLISQKALSFCILLYPSPTFGGLGSLPITDNYPCSLPAGYILGTIISNIFLRGPANFCCWIMSIVTVKAQRVFSTVYVRVFFPTCNSSMELLKLILFGWRYPLCPHPPWATGSTCLLCKYNGGI